MEKKKTASTFGGFSPEALDFLQKVVAYDSKAWYEEHREEYGERLLEPFKNLVTELTPVMRRIDSGFEFRPAVNRTISRIHRDTRFSKDKSLYRDHMWLVFKRSSKEWQDAPAFFFEIAPDFWRYGLGYYRASRSTMDAFRGAIDEDRAAFRRAIRPLVKDGRFELRGEKYKRPLMSEHPDDIQEWYQRKSFYLVRDREIGGVLFSSKLAAELGEGFRTLGSLYRFLRAIR